MTFQRYLLTPEGNKKTVLVIDESSMIGRDQMLSLMRFVNQKKLARVLFQGDSKQMSGVQAGMPFKHMEQAGVRSVKMDEIIRQKDARHRQGITELTKGDLHKAFETLKPEIHHVSKDKMTDYAIKAWRASGNVKTPMIIQTNKQKTEINQAIKQEQLKSNPGAPSLTLKTWQTVHKSDEEKRFVASYKDATHIRFNRTYKRLGIERGDIFKLQKIDPDKAQLTLSKGNITRRFKPAKYKMGKGAIELYRQEERTLHQGDRIRFTRGGNRQPVLNNDYGSVKHIENGSVTFELDRNKTLTLSLKDKAIRHVDHAWASTTHAFQGKTVDHAVVVMPSRKSPLTSLNSLYTAASRHRLSVTIVTDDASRLRGNLEKAINSEKIEAQIRWPEKEAAQRIADQKKAADTLKERRQPAAAPHRKEAQKQDKDHHLTEPIIARAIIEEIRQRQQREGHQPPQQIQRSRDRGR